MEQYTPETDLGRECLVGIWGTSSSPGSSSPGLIGCGAKVQEVAQVQEVRTNSEGHWRSAEAGEEKEETQGLTRVPTVWYKSRARLGEEI